MDLSGAASLPPLPLPSFTGEGRGEGEWAPKDEAGIAQAIRQAHAAREPIEVEGAGTKRGMLRPVQAARTLSTRNLRGITLYAPKELVISARAGTPVAEIEAALAEHGQHLIGELPDLFGGCADQTIGGVIATNLSGPRRVAWGAMRDHVIGVRAVDGAGDVFHSGGRVLKNVTGLDLCKLLTGSHGTLGIMTEITLKVLPAPELTDTIVISGPSAEAGVKILSAALGSPYGVSAAAWLPRELIGRTGELREFGEDIALIRIEDFAASVDYRTKRLIEDLGSSAGGAHRLGDVGSRAAWRAIRDAMPLAPEPGEAVWRVSVRPSSGPGILAATGLRGFLDWGGGLVWLAGDPAAHGAVVQAVTASGGTWTVMRGPDPMRTAVHVIPPEPPALAAIARRVKAVMDPAGILNPGRLAAGA